MKVKSEKEVTQSCPTLSEPMDYSLPGSSIVGFSLYLTVRLSEIISFLLAGPAMRDLTKSPNPSHNLIYKELYDIFIPQGIAMLIIYFCFSVAKSC